MILVNACCRPTAILLLLALTTASCSSQTERAEEGLPSAAPQDANVTTTSGLCTLFTKEEMEKAIGAPLVAGIVSGPLSTVCQWDGTNDTDAVYAQIQVLDDTDYWSNPKQAKGYEALSGIGKEAFVMPDQGGWNARALTDTAVLSVTLNGGQADRDRTVKVLRTLLERLK